MATSQSKASAPFAATSVSLSTAEIFTMGALAAMTAVTVTNPMEVCKTRMQLQGELLSSKPALAAAFRSVKAASAQGASVSAAASNASSAVKADLPNPNKLYKSALDCFAKTLRGEGVRGVQRGIGAAYIYQVLLNGSRLGFYEPIRRTISKLGGRNPSEQWTAGSLMAGASSGIVGAILGNPLFLVKARLQAYSPLHTIGKGGSRYIYKGTFDGLRQIVHAEGFRGLVRGIDAAVLRTAMGSSVQLPAYNWMKTYLTALSPENTSAYNPFLILAGKPDSFFTYLASSIFSGLCVCAVMQPADTALTRMYAQPTRIDAKGRSVGTLYRNPIHCLYLTFRSEGVMGWYKGTTAHLLRIAPHTVLTLVVNEAYLRWYANLKNGRPIFEAPVDHSA